ncbi:MAG TPA: hypothetical protein PK095_22325, partial [Myxococcota bacterium]|nr:hypothetical protein [Myxococcota bacterium]
MSNISIVEVSGRASRLARAAKKRRRGRIIFERAGYSYQVNGNDNPRTFHYLALLVVAQAWVVMAEGQGWGAALAVSLVGAGAFGLGTALFVFVTRAAR